jgi:hypothetical protein
MLRGKLNDPPSHSHRVKNAVLRKPRRSVGHHATHTGRCSALSCLTVLPLEPMRGSCPGVLFQLARAGTRARQEHIMNPYPEPCPRLEPR